MFTLKHLKTLQHVSIIIQIIFRELVCSLLKLLILKFVKNVKVNVVMRQHNIWCVYVRSVWRGVLDCSPAHIFTQNGLQSGTHLHTERTAVRHTFSHRTDCSPAHLSTQNARTQTKCYAAASPH